MGSIVGGDNYGIYFRVSKEILSVAIIPNPIITKYILRIAKPPGIIITDSRQMSTRVHIKRLAQIPTPGTQSQDPYPYFLLYYHPFSRWPLGPRSP